MNELIKLQHAHINQHTNAGVKGTWKIEANHTNEQLGELPARLNENEVFDIIGTARRYELEAFNIGIEFGKNEYRRIFDAELKQYKENMQRAIQENERLADALERITTLSN
jgi:hypothetical protein